MPLEDHATESLVGQAIRAAREAARLSMRAAAGRAGVSQPFFSQIERGLAAPSISTLYRIAAALDVTAADLLPPPVPHGSVVVSRAGEGRRLPVNEGPKAAEARVVVAGEGRLMEVVEYDTTPGDDLDAWFEHEGQMLTFVVDGDLEVDLVGHPTVCLGPGDAVYHDGAIRHRWRAGPSGRVRALLVVAREPGARRDPA
jgi:transcriptional regulator with XRE-family HTH domain